MLEALLEPLSYNESGESETSAERLDEEDRLTIEKCIPCATFKANGLVIQSIRRRLDALRRKLDFASQRNSPTPSLEKVERDRVRRPSSGSTGSAGAVRGGTPTMDSP